MKKIILVLICLQLVYFANSQDYRIGLRFSPLQSTYLSRSYSSYSNSNDLSLQSNISQFDSVGVSIFCDKFFSSKDFFVRAEFSFGKIVKKSSEIQENQINHYKTVNNSEFNQGVYNLNLGIGTRTNLNKFKIYFGVYLPFTFLPEGELIQSTENYNQGVLSYKSEGTGNYHSAFGFGIGSFAGISTTINKNISIGFDLTYQLSYISRNIDLHKEFYYSNSNPTTEFSDEKQTMKNYYTSKITPSITIAYTFNTKAKNGLPSE